jgi:pimeloyl-ACP methyl ester carboxylesterase
VKAFDLAQPINAVAAQSLPPPEVSYHFMELGNTNLHYMKCGRGEPLVMVPATISKIDNWRALAQFMGQRFTVYFFELPGHGKSSPYPEPFSSELVAETVEKFVDWLGHRRFSLMGFSFGGILATKTLYRLHERIDNVVFVSPAVSSAALEFSKPRKWMLRGLVRRMHDVRMRERLLQMIRSRSFSRLAAWGLRLAGRIENTIPMHEVFQKIIDSTADVLSYQIYEMLNFEAETSRAFSQRCYVAMSVFDPLLDFDKTMAVLHKLFSDVYIHKMYLPYHQPPAPPTFEEINQDFAAMLERMSAK